jgi:uncharacterized membrane protein YhaH (DUF805 family)
VDWRRPAFSRGRDAPPDPGRTHAVRLEAIAQTRQAVNRSRVEIAAWQGELDMDNFDVNLAIKYFQDVLTNHYADFKGRVSRRDYWTYVAVVFAVMIVSALVQGIVGLGIQSLVMLGLLIPNAGMTARRLQDTGKDGKLVWILFIPVAVSGLVTFLTAMTFGAVVLLLVLLPFMTLISLVSLIAAIYMIYLCIQPGTPGENPYGPVPSDATAKPAAP